LVDSRHESGNHQREHEIYELGLKLFDDDLNKGDIYRGQLICALSKGDIVESKRIHENYVAVKKRLGGSEETIQHHLADIHWRANLTDSAASMYRKLVEQYPQQNNYKFQLGKLLIEEDLDEGFKLPRSEKIRQVVQAMASQ
jgi:hypothetical protein